MKKITLLLLALGVAGSANAAQMFDFDAQAILPIAPGGTAEAYGVVLDGVATPLPLDFANFQYTIVVTGLVLDSAGTTSAFSGGAVAIYRDDMTAADWNAPATFTDGTAILTGTLTTLQHAMLTATLGTASGYVDWTGGTRLDELAPAAQAGWPFLTGVSRAASQVAAGYTEKWDGKVEPTEDVVATELQSWSGVKALYR